MQYQNFIGGQWVGRQFTSNINPSDTDDIIGDYASASADDTRQAIAAAAETRRLWRNYPSGERAQMLGRIGNSILEQKDELGFTLSREEGKVLSEGVGEAVRAGRTFLYYAAQIEQEQGQLFQSSRDRTSIQTIHNPVGAVGVITPWNFPLAIPAWKIAPALAYGNTVVFKPAEMVPASAWKLAEIIGQSGIPDGVFNLVMGKGSVVGDTMAKSPLLNAITFTGSSATGAGLARDSVAHGMKRVQAEMGGKNSLIVLDDADIATAVDAIIDGAYFSTGQRCTATSRIIATSGVYAEVVDKVAQGIKKLRIGSALDPQSNLGPLASRAQLEQVRDYIDIGIHEGAELVTGGELLQRDTPGYYLQPALFMGGKSQMRINQEEIFGPVACVLEVGGLDEAIAVSNDTPYGLAAGIISNSQKSIEQFRQEVDAGMLHVNRSTALTELHVPFGGSKASSYGSREQGTSSREFFTSVSTSYLTTVA